MSDAKMLKLENEILQEEVAKLKNYISQMEGSTGQTKIYTDKEIDALLKRVNKAGTGKDKLAEVEMAFQSDVKVTAQHAAKLVKACNGQDAEREACIAMYPFLTNKNDLGIVTDVFSYNSNRAKVVQQLL
jgi:hypothetical protein